jgi:hypothetical protein
MIKRVCDSCGRDMPMYPTGQFITTGVAAPVTAVTGDICDECRARNPFSNAQ